MEELSKEDILHLVTFRRAQMRKETWIKNVMRVFPERSLADTEALYDKLFHYQPDVFDGSNELDSPEEALAKITSRDTSLPHESNLPLPTQDNPHTESELE